MTQLTGRQAGALYTTMQASGTSGVQERIGAFTEAAIRLWVRTTGQTVERAAAPWLHSPLGPDGSIGSEIYAVLIRQENLRVETSPDAGLLPDFDALAGKGFDPTAICAEVRDFYEHTARYRLEAWSEANPLTRFFLWGLVTFVSRRMNQLNFPVSPLELSGGMTSEVLPLVDPTNGKRVYTGWLRRLAATGQVVYAGLYSTETPGAFSDPCVKVSFPLPHGSATVFLRPEAQADGSLRLISSGHRFGDPGFYRMLDAGPHHWKVRYIGTLREIFHVYVDKAGTLRTEHEVCFLGLTVLRLHYKITPITVTI